MLHISVCDDSVEFIRVFENQLKYLCKKHFSNQFEYEICDVFNSAEGVLKYLNKEKIDVLFLDIDMPGMNGFELAKRLTVINPDIMIVFVSAHDHYVFEVFEFFPFAYLRKNRIAEELPTILDRIRKRVYEKSIIISLDTTEGIVTVNVYDVSYIKAQKNYYSVNTENGRCYICRGTLSHIEKIWCEYEFYRIHSAYIVNMEHIQSISDNQIIIGLNKEKLPIAQRRLAAFRKAYSEFTLRKFNI